MVCVSGDGAAVGLRRSRRVRIGRCACASLAARAYRSLHVRIGRDTCAADVARAWRSLHVRGVSEQDAVRRGRVRLKDTRASESPRLDVLPRVQL